MTTQGTQPWQVVHVEDDELMVKQVEEWLVEHTFRFGSIRVISTSDFDEAVKYLHERRVDVLILDVLRGDTSGDDRAGINVLDQWKAAGFTPVVLHTALAEGAIEEHKNAFIHVVPKGARSFERIGKALEAIFDTNMPQIHRALVGHVDETIGGYVWNFVVKHWHELEDLAPRPDFLRLLLARVGLELSRGAGSLVERLHGPQDARDNPDVVHPAEYYVRPPIGNDPQLGDLVLLGMVGDPHVVLWPSCDLVSGRQKVSHALCAPTVRLTEFEEYEAWSASPRKQKAADALKALMKNNRRQGQAERYHFLPGAWELSNSVIDFAGVRPTPLQELGAAKRVATLASPFAESVASRFLRYLGRLGTPDLDVESLVKSLVP